MLELKNVSKFYGSQQALKNVNLSIPQGEIIGLFGENGAGKTTLMKCVFGFLPYKGDITYNGEKITNKTLEDLGIPHSNVSLFLSSQIVQNNAPMIIISFDISSGVVGYIGTRNYQKKKYVITSHISDKALKEKEEN